MQTFSKEFRLTSKQDFANLKEGSTRLSASRLVVYYKVNILPHARVGFSISKRIAKAHLRNRYRRTLKELFRRSDIRNVSVDVLIVVVSPGDLLAQAKDLFERIVKNVSK